MDYFHFTWARLGNRLDELAVPFTRLSNVLISCQTTIVLSGLVTIFKHGVGYVR